MKKTIIFLASFLFALNLDTEIEYIMQLPPKQRYIAINKLKQEISKLKEEERIKAIKKLLLHYHINNPTQSIIKGKK